MRADGPGNALTVEGDLTSAGNTSTQQSWKRMSRAQQIPGSSSGFDRDTGVLSPASRAAFEFTV